jgi:hypothetical protein
MPSFEHSIVIVIEADTFEESAQIAEDIAEGLGVEGENASVPPYEHDNEGQRVLYLLPEGVSLEEHNNAPGISPATITTKTEWPR